MANFNGFPGMMPGQQMYNPVPYPMPQQAQQSAQQLDERIWVANEMAAESYLVAPNSFVRLWDSNKNVFYEKRADATGRLFPMEAYRYEKVEANRAVENNNATIDYIKEIEALKGRVLALEGGRKHEQSNTNTKRS